MAGPRSASLPARWPRPRWITSSKASRTTRADGRGERTAAGDPGRTHDAAKGRRLDPSEAKRAPGGVDPRHRETLAPRGAEVQVVQLLVGQVDYDGRPRKEWQSPSASRDQDARQGTEHPRSEAGVRHAADDRGAGSFPRAGRGEPQGAGKRAFARAAGRTGAVCREWPG
jgi:hypothetical protein